MINVTYAKRSQLYIFSLSPFHSVQFNTIALRASTNKAPSCSFCSVLYGCRLSYVSISNKPAWFMVMWKMPRNGMAWHVSRTNLNTYMHLIVYILCTPTYLFSSIFINIYYENESNSNRMVSHCWLQLMLKKEKRNAYMYTHYTRAHTQIQAHLQCVWIIC